MYRLQSLDKLLYPLFPVTNLQWCALFRVGLLGGVNVLYHHVSGWNFRYCSGTKQPNSF